MTFHAPPLEMLMTGKVGLSLSVVLKHQPLLDSVCRTGCLSSLKSWGYQAHIYHVNKCGVSEELKNQRMDQEDVLIFRILRMERISGCIWHNPLILLLRKRMQRANPLVLCRKDSEPSGWDTVRNGEFCRVVLNIATKCFYQVSVTGSWHQGQGIHITWSGLYMNFPEFSLDTTRREFTSLCGTEPYQRLSVTSQSLQMTSTVSYCDTVPSWSAMISEGWGLREPDL